MSNTKSPIGDASGSRPFAAAAADTARSLIHESDFKDFPQIDVIKLIKLIIEVSKGEKTKEEAAKEFGVPYMAFAKVFIVNKSKELISLGFEQISANPPEATNTVQPDFNTAKTNHDTIDAQKPHSKKSKAATASKTQPKAPQTNSEIQNMAEDVAKHFINEAVVHAGMEELAKADFDERLIACTVSTAALVKQYVLKEITVQAFIEKLGNGQIKDITNEVLKASGMDRQLAEHLDVENLSDIKNMAPNVVAFAAFTAAYKMVREAQEDLEIANAHRVEIEAACNESITLIRQYRQEMEEVVNKYLTDRIEIFKSGFEAMDKAILENDSNGYIQGNAAIQGVLGYKPQFTNQEEFDDLMDSDEDFKL